ncbi:MAG: 2-C-methyl-D-erythritol 4-phosphate cytidylyltransferase [Defluviitaleaceae bacterium]|nr:2-C-methyl-D-erythritol 4-phosphate cytidylyltransferase [Defluviitaleaceae bacterium]
MVSVIIPASGSGTRFGGDVPKQFLPIKGIPVLARTAMAFQRTERVGEIAVTVPKGYTENVREMVRTYNLTKVKHIVEGGASRSESVYEALKQIDGRTEIVLVHDGVRPFVSCDLIEKTIDAVKRHGAAIVGTPFTDTVKEADADGRVYATPERGRFWQVQTPQGFTYKLLTDAYKNALNLADYTDDSAIVEHNGGITFIIQGERNNIKITTQEDLIMANTIMGMYI